MGASGACRLTDFLSGMEERLHLPRSGFHLVQALPIRREAELVRLCHALPTPDGKLMVPSRLDHPAPSFSVSPFAPWPF